jgi:pSer/pThr/pTyr-binding forkhead associated (FHA) protein
MGFNEDTTFPDMLPPSMGSLPPKLIVASGEATSKEYPLIEFPKLIGRSPNAEIQIPSPTVSREHAKVLKEMGKIVIKDLGSTNGVFVNNFKIERWILADGDSIRIGNTIFLFRAEQKDKPASPDQLKP